VTRPLLLACLLLVATPAAEAATVSVGTRQDFPTAPPNGIVHFDAAPGEANDLTWSFPSSGGVRLHDAGAAITAGTGCTALDARTVLCTSERPTWFIDARLGDGADRAAPAATEGAQGATSVEVHGGDGNDALSGGAVPHRLAGDAGDDDLRTGLAYGSADGGDGNDVLTGNGGLGGGAGNDRLTGGPGFGQLSGGTGDDIADGGGGSDSLVGGGGHDVLRGGPGNDSISDGDGPAFPLPLGPTGLGGPQAVDADVMDGGDGSDSLEYGLRTAAVTADLSRRTAGQAGEGDTVTGFENVNGGAGDDHLTGDGGPNRISGGDGRDVISAGGGDDDVYAGWASTVRLGAGNDSLLQSQYSRRTIARFGTVDCGTGSDSVRYPNPRTRAPRACETLQLRDWARIRRPASRTPGVQCGPFRSSAVKPCIFRLRLQLPRGGNSRTGYTTGGTPLGATPWRSVAGGRTVSFPLRLGAYGRAQLRARGTMAVRVILERRTGTRSRGYVVGPYITIFR
jgi:Ca2+-binding RTX toxin-like protein